MEVTVFKRQDTSFKWYNHSVMRRNIMNDTVIKIDNVCKQYRLGTIGGSTLRGDIESWWAKVRHKEDPNIKIGHKAYSKNEKFMALDGINLEVHKGDTLGIIGGNGAGKSTTLKLLSRVTAPTSGNIYIKGKISSMLEVGTGFHPELTGRENIYLNGAILGMKKSEVSRKIDDIIEFSECSQFIDTPVKRYSSGMFVKLAFSVAAHLDSDILLMDEVLAVGDMNFQKKCIDKMLSIANEAGRTIIYVSHNMNTVRQLCNRGVVMKKGKIIYDGDTDTAIKLYLDSSKTEQKLFNDFTNSRRPDFLTDKLRFESLEVIGRENLSIKDGEEIRMRIKWKALKDIPSLSVRMMVHNVNNEPIATSICPDFIQCRAGETYSREFIMNTEALSTGSYRLLMAAYELDDIGGVIDTDAVWPALSFDRIKDSSVNWKAKLFGDIELPQMHVVE